LDLAPGAEAGDISIAKGEAGWCWQIPIGRRWSVGLVLKREFIQAPTREDSAEHEPVIAVRDGPAADDLFRRHIGLFPTVADRLAGQVPQPARAFPNISYRGRDRLRPGFALPGAAGGFIAPSFSSGVLLATRAAWRLGEAPADGHDLAEWKRATDHDLTSY